MPRVLVSDTSILIDLERGGILEIAFGLSVDLAVPDLLFNRELANDGGQRLIELGLVVEELDGDGVGAAQAYLRRKPALSLPDAFALALACAKGWMLLTGDGDLRQLADAEHVECHGLLWLIDLIDAERLIKRPELHRALSAIASHRRCRLPKKEVAASLARLLKER